MKASKKFTLGFTLIEMLIALTLLSIIMLAFMNILTSSLKATRTLNNQANLLIEAQTAQNFVANRIQEAVCLYPQNQVVTLGNSAIVRNTLKATPNQSWTVGQDPFIAMVVPPAAGSTMFRFFAYYPMRRADFLTASTLPPDADPQNDQSTWVLLEYRSNFDPNDIIANFDPQINRIQCDNNVLNLIQGNQGRLLADYIQPAVVGNYQLFAFNATSRSIIMSLRFQRKNRDRLETFPGSRSLFTTSLNSRNFFDF